MLFRAQNPEFNHPASIIYYKVPDLENTVTELMAKAVKIENSLQFVEALHRANVPFDFHVYQKGPHGIGLSQGKNGVAPDDVHPWGKDLIFWLKAQGFVR